MKHQYFYKVIQENDCFLPQMVKKIAQFIKFLNHFEVIHGDLRPANLIVECDDINTSKSYQNVTNVKVFNFASSFDANDEQDGLGMRDVYFPEYAPPEILEYRNKVQNPVHTNKTDKKHEPKDSARGKRDINDKHNTTEAEPKRENQDLLDQYEGNIWAYDVWSLGVIMLEIATGCPIYIAKKAIIIKAPEIGKDEGRAAKDHQPTQPMMGKGLFGIESKQNHLSSLVVRQKLIVEKLKTSLSKCETYGIADDKQFINLVTKMLELDPKKRISPQDIINHPYCARSESDKNTFTNVKWW